jgi:hypothetical protein
MSTVLDGHNLAELVLVSLYSHLSDETCPDVPRGPPVRTGSIGLSAARHLSHCHLSRRETREERHEIDGLPTEDQHMLGTKHHSLVVTASSSTKTLHITQARWGDH